jgi:hypothetical protein
MNEWIYLEKLIWFLCRYDLLCHVIITLYFIYRIMGVRLMQNKLDLMVLMVYKKDYTATQISQTYLNF